MKLKESAMLVMLLLVLAVPATGVVVEQTIGSYTISFDLADPSLKINSTACFWNATDNMGYIRIEQKSHQRETFHPNGGKLGSIMIFCSNSGAPVLLSEYDNMKTVAKADDINYKKDGFTNTTLYKRLVDNDPNAAVFVANSPYGMGDNLYMVRYRYDIHTQVSFIGKMDGFDTFLNTIHLTVKNSDANKETQPSQPATDVIFHHFGLGNYTFDDQDKVRATVKKGTDVVHMMAMEELPTDYGYTKDLAQYTVTSTGTHIKGYIDYTLDGYVIVMQPRTSSLTKGEFMAILDTFHRID